MKKETYSIGGMHCGSCAINIGMALEAMDGVKSAKTDYESKKVEIEYDPEKTGFDKFSEIVEAMGYKLVKN